MWIVIVRQHSAAPHRRGPPRAPAPRRRRRHASLAAVAFALGAAMGCAGCCSLCATTCTGMDFGPCQPARIPPARPLQWRSLAMNDLPLVLHDLAVPGASLGPTTSLASSAFPAPASDAGRRRSSGVAHSQSVELLIKRDDLSGFGRGGAKARKIDHLVGYLGARGYDELIAVTGNVTNLAFDLVPALDARGIRSTLFITDDPPAPPREREAIFGELRGRVELVGGSRDALLAVTRAYRAARRAGRHPFIVLPGISHPAGVIGNAAGFVEMALQLAATGHALPEMVFVTAATGTTVAGFLLAESALRQAGFPAIRVVGVQVYPGALRQRTALLLRWTERFFGLGRAGSVVADRSRVVRASRRVRELSRSAREPVRASRR